MNTSRRSFPTASGILPAGAPLTTYSNAANRIQLQFGLQLYSLRDVIVDSPEEIIRKAAGFGYRQIESYEGPLGMYWGMGNIGFKKLMDDLDATLISSHADVFNDFERKAAEAAEIGVAYLVCPWLGSLGNLHAYREMADRFNEIGRVAKKAGITFAYHNHDYSFREIDGEVPQKILMDNTDPELVEYQMDIYWVAAAGHDPEEWIRAYPNRFTSSHVKDGKSGNDGGDMEATILGAGIIDYPRILKLAKDNGMKYFIVEQEAHTGTTPLDAARENAVYMKNLRIS